MMGDAFDKKGIAVHFDAGDSYDPTLSADPYIIRGTGLARGGESIDEMRTVCARAAGDPPWMCQFSGNPGTLGWKTGFRYMRDEVLGSAPAPTADEDDVCETPSSPYFAQDGLVAGAGNDCERRFDRVRKDMFHYAFFAHALGLPRAEMPCLDASDKRCAEPPVAATP